MKMINVLTIVCLGLVAATTTASCSLIEDRLSQVETQLEGVGRDNAFLKTEIRDLKHEDGINKQSIAQLKEDNKSIRTELAYVKKERQVDREEIKKLKGQVDSLRKELEGAVSDIDGLKTKIQVLESCCCGGGDPITSTILNLIDESTSSPSTTEITTWPINAEIEFVDVNFAWGKIVIFKDFDMVVVGGTVNKVYDLRTRQLVRTFGEGHPAVFKQNQLIIASRSGPISIWNVETGELVNRLVGDYTEWIFSSEFNKNQSLMLTGGEDYIIRLWDMIELRQVRTFTGHTGHVRSVVFDEARSQVISGSGDIRVWNINDGSLVRTMNSHSRHVNKLLLDEKIGRLFSASNDRTIKEWDIESGTVLRTLTGHSEIIFDLIFSEDGQRLISSSFDKSIIIWDKKSGQHIKQLKHTTEVFYLALNRLNGQLLSTNNDTKLIFWSLKP